MGTKTSILRQQIRKLLSKPYFILLIIAILIGLTIIGQIGFIISLLFVFMIYWLSGTSLQELGLSAPKSWIKTIGIGILLTFVILLVFTLINPILTTFFPEEIKSLNRFDTIRNNELMLILAILSSWVTAGFGEEIIWRGFILKRTAFLLGNKKASWIISLIMISSLFGLAHFYQGIIGIIQTGIVGFFLGSIYILNGKKSLWLTIIIHGCIDTISMIAIYYNIV